MYIVRSIWNIYFFETLLLFNMRLVDLVYLNGTEFEHVTSTTFVYVSKSCMIKTLFLRNFIEKRVVEMHCFLQLNKYIFIYLEST